MRLVAFIAIVSFAGFVAPVQAQATKEEAITNLAVDVLDAIGQAREEKSKRQMDAVQKQSDKWAQEAQAREQQLKADQKRREALASNVRQWPGLGGLRPPLQPGEIYLQTRNGCGIVLSAGVAQAASKGSEAPGDYVRGAVWTGECAHGLAHGFGMLAQPKDLVHVADMKQEYAYGRILSRTFQPHEVSYRGPDQMVVTIPSSRDPFVPRFGEFGTPESTALTTFSHADGARMTTVRAVTKDCLILSGKKLRGCSYENNFKAYLVNVSTSRDKDFQNTETLCPDPRSPTKCEALWQELAGPVIEQIKPIMARADAQDAARRTELERMHAMHVLNYRVNEMARQAAAQQDIARREAVASAALERMRKEREAAAAVALAEKEKAEREFKSRLTTLNAGQLYVLADELKVAGKTTQAREALRAFIERFPDHNLSANAAATLSTLR